MNLLPLKWDMMPALASMGMIIYYDYLQFQNFFCFSQDHKSETPFGYIDILGSVVNITFLITQRLYNQPFIQHIPFENV